ncbi:MAG: tetratricopeptide repeat protein, partial [Chloroflexota bacterium]
MSSMRRNTLRVFFVLVLLALAVCTPLVASGYSELNKAMRSNSYLEAAAHYQAAAQRIPWRADLYEFAGHAHYHAKDYDRASAAYQKAFSRRALSPAGWMAWGDVHYLSDDSDGARQIWEEALKQPDPSDQLYSRLAEIYQSNGDFSKAAEYLQKYVSAYPEDASAHYRLGLLLSLSDP